MDEPSKEVLEKAYEICRTACVALSTGWKIEPGSQLHDDLKDMFPQLSAAHSANEGSS